MRKEIPLNANFSIDSRTIKDGDVFIALKGDRYDGNDFVIKAIENGASCAISEKAFDDEKVITVDDSYKYMIELSNAKRAKLTGKVIGITGSVGKTTCKEYLSAYLKLFGKTYSTIGNLNNHIGLPLSILNTPIDTEFCIYELGINHPGEMSFLSNLAKPDIAIITNISTIHIEFFDAVINIADEKFRIVDKISENGCLLLNLDDAFSSYLLEKAQNLGIQTNLYSGNPCAKVLELLGIKDQGLPKPDISLKGRGETHTLSNGAILIDHSYNASLDSMRYAIKEAADYQGRRKVAILGNMFELGEMSKPLHFKLLPIIDKYDTDKVIMCGELFQEVFDHLPLDKQAFYADSVQEIIPIIQEIISPNDVIIVKGSHSTHLDKLVEFLLTL